MTQDTNRRTVLLVDDSTSEIHILTQVLKDDYTLLAATSGEKALELLKQTKPDVILLDIMMPGMDGYETCRCLKDDNDLKEIDVIFVSSHNTVEEKLKGYEAGGIDYLIKPVQPAELQQKVKLAIKNKDERAGLAVEKNMAMQTAMTAISSIGEQGVVLDFMRRSYTVESIEELSRLIVEATQGYGLESSVQIRMGMDVFHASTSEPMAPLEQELLQRLKDAGRLREKDSHLVANFGDITQLIKNMPDDDEDKRGRLRDHLAILLEGAEARLNALVMDQKLAKLIENSKQALLDIQAMQKDQKKNAMKIMDEVMLSLEESFLSYGLTEDQEKLLLNVVQVGVDKSLENFEEGLNIDEQMHEIINSLEQFVKH